MNACPEGVRADGLVDPGFAGEAADDPPGRVSVQPSPVSAEEGRSVDPFTDGEVDGARGSWGERDGDDLAALAVHGQGAMAAFEAERFDVGAERFGDSQPVDGQQRDERVLARRGQSRGDEQRTDLVAVQTGGVGLVVEARAPNMSRGRPLQQAFLLGVAVEARHRAQTACHCRQGASTGFEVSREALDVSPAHAEQAEAALLAPGDELAQIQGVGLAGQAAVAGKERSERVPLGIGERRSTTATSVVGVVVVTLHLQVRPRPRGRSANAPAAC
jgi:hypothetical protein